MSRNYKKLSIFILVIHLCIFVLCVKTNTVRGINLEEARYIPAGVRHWRNGQFRPANDSPPLARMIAALPLMEDAGLPSDALMGDASGARDREMRFGGRFASPAVNLYWYRLFCLARMAGFAWWLLGAWVIARWSGELSGAPAAILALSLWCVCPNVLAFEQRATPEFPTVVIWAVATYAFRGYLRAPSRSRALAAGLLLGVAQLVGFISLALFLLWPLLALQRRLTRPDEAPVALLPTRILQSILIVAACLCVVNLGYGFGGSGTPLGSYEFQSRALAGSSHSQGGPSGPGVVGNRFRGTWLGRLAGPLPAEYLRGLDRRLFESERPAPRTDEDGWPAEVGPDPLASAGERRPIGLWVMMVGSLIPMLAGRRPGGTALPEVLSLWSLVGVILLMTLTAVDRLAGASGLLLMTPFAIIIASGLAPAATAGPRVIRWATALLSAGAIAACAHAIFIDEMTPENRARFLRDLDKYCRLLGFDGRRQGAADVAELERGLLYRTFVDSRGVAMNYALFVPQGYRGERAYPLILFLHGHGDRGTTGRQFTAVGLPFTLEHHEIDFLVVCPQGWSGSWEPGGDDARRAMELLDAVEKDYRVNPGQVYLTGLSSGGTAVWDLAAEYPRRWAAIVPVASAPPDPGQAPRIKGIPCWCFHDRYDGGSPVERVRAMIAALRAAGGRPKYTEYLDVNHGAWDRAYNAPEFFDWLSRQRLP